MSVRDELRIRSLDLGGTISACWSHLEAAGRFDQKRAEAAVEATRDAILAAGYRKVDVVTEWGAAHAENGAIYNIYSTREDAQASLTAWPRLATP